MLCIVDPNSILVRHRKFLKQLEAQKNLEREEEIEAGNEAARKKANFRDQAARQRSKIKNMKSNEIQNQNMEVFDQIVDEVAPASAMSKPLTAENLKAASQASSKKVGGGGKKGMKGGKPVWAQT